MDIGINSLLVKAKVFLTIIIAFLFSTSKAQEMDEIIEDDSFLIVENPQKIYEGIYRNDEPFSGYFAKGNREFPRVDYYEKGKRVYQYSLDLLQMVLSAEMGSADEEVAIDTSMMSREAYEQYKRELYKPKLNIKSFYRNDKIVEGYEYEDGSSTLISKKISNGKIVEFHVDLFAMHFYQRISIILGKDQIRVVWPLLSEMEKTQETVICYKNNMWNVACGETKNKETSFFFARYMNQDFPPNCVVYLSDIANTTYFSAKSVTGNGDICGLPDLSIFDESTQKAISSDDITLLFHTILEAYKKEFIPEESVKESGLDKVRAFLVTNSDGSVKNGVRYFDNGEKTYYVEYKNSKEIKRQTVDMDLFQEIVLKIIKSGYD